MSLADCPPRAERTPINERTLGDIVREALPYANLQIIGECIVLVQLVAKCKPPACRVTFLTGTENITPSDVLNPETARNVGIVIWVPRDIYLGK